MPMRGQITVRPDSDTIVDPFFLGDTAGASEIAGWMSGDIQMSIEEIDGYIATFKQFARDKKPGWCFGYGNAHGVFAHESYVYIECEFDDEGRVLLTTDQIVSALTIYKQILLDGIQDTSFEVSYLAEDDEAEQRFMQITGVDDLADICARGRQAHMDH